eukprot:scaffold225046_cov56-Cyclotella_meneghiniana.AAC.2
MTPFQNAKKLYESHPPNHPILPMPSNMSFHDLTYDKSAPPYAKCLLGLGSKFIPTPSRTASSLASTFSRLTRDLKLRVYFACEDANGEDEEDRPKLYVKSKWNPEEQFIPSWVDGRLERFYTALSKLFSNRKASTNLLPPQQQLLDTLPSSEQHLFPETDKGLGPCCVRTEQYLEDAAVHLNNKDVYEILSEEEAILLTDVLHTNIIDWLKEYKSNIGIDAYDFIHEHLHKNLAHPFGQFYILYKIHKGMKKGRWPTRPVCSDVSSLTHGLGKWVSEMLIPIQKAQPSYFQDSFALKLLLDALELPHNAQLFTADATSMYTVIKTEPALASIKKYIDEEVTSMSDERKEALHAAMALVFKNNVFKFGDAFIRQCSGTAMGTPPAPPYATIFYTIHEKVLLSKWSTRVMFYKRFIDDVIGVWLAYEDPVINKQLWEEFEADMNKWHDLEWTCETPSHSVNFMDLTITIVDNHIETKLYEKDMNLYLYLPPHSSHPRGVFTGLVFGQILRTRRLCTHSADADSSINDFWERMLARGHTQESLAPLFAKANENAKAFLSRTPAEREAIKKQKGKDAHNQLFLHLQFHPDDPSTREIQKLWQELVLQPKGEIPLPDMENADGVPVGVNKLIVAYSRPLNLKNRFYVRDIHGRGRPALEYLAK